MSDKKNRSKKFKQKASAIQNIQILARTGNTKRRPQLQRFKLYYGNNKDASSKIWWSRKEERLNDAGSDVLVMAQALDLNPKIALNQSGYNFTRVDYISTRSILVNCGSVPLKLPETVIHRRPPCYTENRFHFSLSSIRVKCGSQPFISLSSIWSIDGDHTILNPLRPVDPCEMRSWTVDIASIFYLSTSTVLFWK
jgi:hypothetical protein